MSRYWTVHQLYRFLYHHIQLLTCCCDLYNNEFIEIRTNGLSKWAVYKSQVCICGLLSSCRTSKYMYRMSNLKVFGCDNVTSGMSVDGCGICGGDNSTCQIVEAVYTDQVAKGRTINQLKVVQNGASHIDLCQYINVVINIIFIFISFPRRRYRRRCHHQQHHRRRFH